MFYHFLKAKINGEYHKIKATITNIEAIVETIKNRLHAEEKISNIEDM
jgi:hypothetical protein